MILVGLILGLALLELGARLFTRADPVAENTWARRVLTHRHAGLLHMPDPILGWRNRPGVETDFESPEFRVHVRINDLGLRGAPVPKSPPSGRRRVLLVGDSFVFGWGVEEEQTFAAELVRLLPELETVSMGVAGYGTDQELIWLRREGLALRPDLVVACFYINDLIDNVSPVRWSHNKPTFRLGADGSLLETLPPAAPAAPARSEKPAPPAPAWPGERIDDWMVSHLRIYSLLRPRIATLAVRAGWMTPEEGLDDYVAYFRRAASPAQEAQWRLAEAELAAMDQAARAQGARFAVLVVPAKVQVQKDVRARVLRAYGLRAADFDFGGPEERLAAWGRTAGVPVLTVHPDLERAAATRRLYYQFDGHWNREGHKAAAAALARELDGLARR